MEMKATAVIHVWK